MRIGRKPLEWIKPDTHGIPPEPRYNHTMNYYEDGNYLIVHGGRNDFSNESFSLNDTFILELHKFDWIRVKVILDHPNMEIFKRCGHGSIIYSKYFYI